MYIYCTILVPTNWCYKCDKWVNGCQLFDAKVLLIAGVLDIRYRFGMPLQITNKHGTISQTYGKPLLHSQSTTEFAKNLKLFLYFTQHTSNSSPMTRQSQVRFAPKKNRFLQFETLFKRHPCLTPYINAQCVLFTQIGSKTRFPRPSLIRRGPSGARLLLSRLMPYLWPYILRKVKRCSEFEFWFCFRGMCVASPFFRVMLVWFSV